MSRQVNPSTKAIKERKFRKREKERKHFEGPLRHFIEHKYRNIFQEYVELYDLMVANHPGKRNLVKTKTFRDWMRTNKASPLTSDILSTVIRETFGQNNMEGDETANTENEGDEAVNTESEGNEAVNTENEGDEAVNTENEGDEAVNTESEGDEAVNTESEGDEAVSTENKGVAANVLVDIEGQVDVIMNEIMQDEELRNLLNSEPEDEGIEITPDDDIVFDIEPFDFELEVEQYEW